jgi:hypothetical protein
MQFITIHRVFCPRGYEVILWTDSSKSDIKDVRLAVTLKEAKQAAKELAREYGA